ncbi:phosphoribosylaminoimidazole-succinocarboxamide synthase-like protein [Westerdykella ornata]|uniref:Phosphoribosylaminoimidazole-succinocarboxamide synthase n=1 Tax=Westerdykella ornata TaxID=318751 RepID=A0A6A6JCG9_WESOR|nr:phosphoribosylaminoimidazole-succinocarboxamide synthase-like protein [Westerdykella ornata]KAF2273698.1 phosphoribosylaminoimidazole-succinocarboxamide synthase-like protein [Westerdykella ornata]
MSSKALVQVDLQGKLPRVASGKVRDLYEIDNKTLLFVASDRISAYDVIMENGIPEKGAILTAVSIYWFNYLTSKIPGLRTHFLRAKLPEALESLPADVKDTLRPRSMQVRKLEVFKVESIVRGYITGSGWAEYQKSGTVCGIKLPAGLVEGQKLEKPLWTPSTKADYGEKDENISPAQAAEILGADFAREIERLSLEIYTAAAQRAEEVGIILADTKFEFGKDVENGDKVVLIDEVLTPDSSRFWPKETWEANLGRAQPSFDKQYLRNWLTDNGLKGKEGVTVPEEVVLETAKKYKEAYERLTGQKWKGS